MDTQLKSLWYKNHVDSTISQRTSANSIKLRLLYSSYFRLKRVRITHNPKIIPIPFSFHLYHPPSAIPHHSGGKFLSWSAKSKLPNQLASLWYTFVEIKNNHARTSSRSSSPSGCLWRAPKVPGSCWMSNRPGMCVFVHRRTMIQSQPNLSLHLALNVLICRSEHPMIWKDWMELSCLVENRLQWDWLELPRRPKTARPCGSACKNSRLSPISPLGEHVLEWSCWPKNV